MPLAWIDRRHLGPRCHQGFVDQTTQRNIRGSTGVGRTTPFFGQRDPEMVKFKGFKFCSHLQHNSSKPMGDPSFVLRST